MSIEPPQQSFDLSFGGMHLVVYGTYEPADPQSNWPAQFEIDSVWTTPGRMGGVNLTPLLDSLYFKHTSFSETGHIIQYDDVMEHLAHQCKEQHERGM